MFLNIFWVGMFVNGKGKTKKGKTREVEGGGGI
jgi:hypothetical protein